MTAATTSDLLADPATLAARLGVDATDPSVIGAVRSASARFRTAVRHPVSRIVDDVVLLDADGSSSILLPAAPVVEIAEVLVDGEPVEDYQISTGGMLRRDAGWPDALGSVTVTYTHGYDPVPAEIVDAVLHEAEVAYGGSADVASMTVGGQQVTFRQGVSAQWSAAVAVYRLNRGDRS